MANKAFIVSTLKMFPAPWNHKDPTPWYHQVRMGCDRKETCTGDYIVNLRFMLPFISEQNRSRISCEIWVVLWSPLQCSRRRARARGTGHWSAHA